MNQSTLSRHANPKTKYNLPRPDLISAGQRSLENCNQVWPTAVPAEVEKLKPALAECQLYAKIRLREIRTLKIRNLKLSQY